MICKPEIKINTDRNYCFRMIKDIVVAIVQDYNLLRKELKLDYNENEIKTGIPEL